MLLVISGDQSERRPIWRGEIIPMQLSWRRKDHPGDLTLSGGGGGVNAVIGSSLSCS